MKDVLFEKEWSVPSDMFALTYRLVLLVLVFPVFISCMKENGPSVGPDLALVADPGYVSGDTLVSPGKSISFKVAMTGGSEKLTNFYIEVTGAGQTAVRYFDTAMFVDNLLWTGRFYKSPASHETWTFIVRDRQGGSVRKTLNILGDTVSYYGPVNNLVQLVLGGQNNDQAGCFYSFASETVYNTSLAKENQGLIDLVFYYGDDEQTIASPGANIEDGIFISGLSPVDWEIRNTTRYIKTDLSPEDFNNINNDSLLIARYVDAEGKRKAKNLADGDIYVFKTQQNRLGMFRVNSVTGTGEGMINLDVKIQPGNK